MAHVLLATVENPHDPKAWSGTPYNILKALEKRFSKVTVISSTVPKKNVVDGVLRLILGSEKYPLWMTDYALKEYGKRVNSSIEECRPDAILCISSQHLIYADTGAIPTFMISDAPWISYKEAYQDFDPQPLQAERYAKLEAKVAQRISGVVFPTPWACAQAREKYDVTADKINCLSFGANSFSNESDAHVFERVFLRSPKHLNFLFIGKDWERKGGPLAVQIVSRLNAMGQSASLHVVGCQPEVEDQHQAYVKVSGFLSPSTSEGKAALVNAFLKADFFLTPSRAECFGLVFAEAQSYGLPCISLKKHGIPGVVDNNVTGLLFEENAPADYISKRISVLVSNWPAYSNMAIAARKKFSEELNWESFSEKLHSLIFNARALSHSH